MRYLIRLKATNVNDAVKEAGSSDSLRVVAHDGRILATLRLYPGATMPYLSQGSCEFYAVINSTANRS